MGAENIKMLEQYLSYASTKNRVINKNIANVGTKDYKREDVEFKDVLSDSMGPYLKVTEDKHIGNAIPQGEESSIQVDNDDNQDMASGINNVDIDKEMADLAENSLKFKFIAKKIGNYYHELQTVINEGGKA